MNTSTATVNDENLSVSAEMGAEEMVSVETIMAEIDVIMAACKLYWERNSINPQKETGVNARKKINDLCMKLFKRLKEEHPKFGASHTMLLFNFVHGIYHRDSLLKYFDTVKRNPKATQEDEMYYISQYTAWATAEIGRLQGRKITKKAVREHRDAIFESMKKTKEDFKKAVEEIKKERAKDRQTDESKGTEGNNEGTNEQEDLGSIRNVDKPFMENTYKLFAHGRPEDTNEIFKKAVEDARMAALVAEESRKAEEEKRRTDDLAKPDTI